MANLTENLANTTFVNGGHTLACLVTFLSDRLSRSRPLAGVIRRDEGLILLLGAARLLDSGKTTKGEMRRRSTKVPSFSGEEQ